MKNRVRDEFHFWPLNKLIAHLHSTLYACMHLMKWSNKFIFIFICFYWSILHSDDGHIFKTGMQISLSYKGICEIDGHFRKKFKIFTIVCILNVNVNSISRFMNVRKWTVNQFVFNNQHQEHLFWMHNYSYETELVIVHATKHRWREIIEEWIPSLTSAANASIHTNGGISSFSFASRAICKRTRES